ncbi:MAG: FAD-dependent oxidoreductase [Gracilibacteraceae bacterium]|jgi:fumarate reductase flavoprotein subunit|nr:FAD-dependent oxidoreductase [Gracilibacteraceae bacterium]
MTTQGFDTEYDLIVAGSGASGKSAALTAAQAGLKVVIFEKMPETGGTSIYAEGTCAFESSEQKARGTPSNPKYHYPTKAEGYAKFNAYSHQRANVDVVRAFVDNSAETIDILKSLGAVYKDVRIAAHDDPNELWTFHLPEGLGAACQELLLSAVQKAGVDIFTSTPVRELITENGAVVGVVAHDAQGGDLMRVGGKAVILATGGLGNSPELVAKYTWFAASAHNMTVLTPLENVGDGLNMALAAGADDRNIVSAGLVAVCARNKAMDSHVGAAGLQPCVWVNKTARRFINEGIAENIGDIGPVLAKQPDGIVYGLLDEADIQRLIKEGSEISIGEFVVYGRPLTRLRLELDQDVQDGVAWKSDTIEGLAQAIGLEKAVLAQTTTEYNAACAAGHDPHYFKQTRYLRPLKQPPFYAISIAPGMMSSTGGLRTNGDMQVVNRDYQPIPGLYAVGLDAGGLYGDSYNMEIPGAANGFAYTSGRIAARHVVSVLKG